MLIEHIRAFLKKGRVKVMWTTLTVHLLDFKSLDFADVEVLKGTTSHQANSARH